jgi:DNA modification methylase
MSENMSDKSSTYTGDDMNNILKLPSVQQKVETGVIYCADNLEVMRQMPSESIDLIYIDPPFFSNKVYETIWGDKEDTASFDDRWEAGINHYVDWMAKRLEQMHRLLKTTGSIYVHLDDHAIHNVKVQMDKIFGESNFRNEIIWKRSSNCSSINGIFRRAHDSILFYSKSEQYHFEIQRMELSDASKGNYSKKDDNGIYRLVPLMVSEKRNGETGKAWRGIDPNTRGKSGMHWVTKHSNLEQYDKDGLIVWSKNGIPNLKYYLKENKGVACNDVWDDIMPIQSNGKESVGYPTQKPEALLERILKASSKEGDVVADFFCGCGTLVAVAQKTNRKWIGVDCSPVASKIIRKRLSGIGYDCQEIPLKNLTKAQILKMHHAEFEEYMVRCIGGEPNKKKVGDSTSRCIITLTIIDFFVDNFVPIMIAVVCTAFFFIYGGNNYGK